MHRLFQIVLPLLLTHILNAQTYIAVMDLEARGVSSIEASTLTDRLRIELFQTKAYTVLERGIMDQILAEQGFQETGCVTTECVVEVGRIFGVERIVTGSVSKVGDMYSISARFVSVETGEIIRVSIYDHEGRIEDLLRFGMRVVASELAGVTTREPRITSQPIREAPSTSLQIITTDQEKSVSGAFIRSLILPGWGHAYTGNIKRGRLFFGCFLYGIIDFMLGPVMEIEPFASDEFGFTTFKISGGVAYIIGPIDAARMAIKHNENLKQNSTEGR